MSDKTLVRLAKTATTNLREDLKNYEEPDMLYEFLMILSTGKLPPLYRAARVLAVGNKILTDVFSERDSKRKGS